MTSIALAQAFAETAHAGQSRLGRAAEPWLAHVADVATAIAAFAARLAASRLALCREATAQA